MLLGVGFESSQSCSTSNTLFPLPVAIANAICQLPAVCYHAFLIIIDSPSRTISQNHSSISCFCCVFVLVFNHSNRKVSNTHNLKKKTSI